MTRIYRIVIALVFAALLIVPTSLVQAGNVISMGAGHKVTVKHDVRPGCKVTVFWLSDEQKTSGGMCHRATIESGHSATHEFTEEQLKGQLSIMVVVEFPDPALSDKVQVAKGIITADKNVIVPVSKIVGFGDLGYADKNKVFSALNQSN